MNARVLYVMGEGRSGSTVLDMLLSNHPSIVGVGELWTFFEADLAIPGTCGCGEPFPGCTHWAEVRPRYLARMAPSSLAELGIVRGTQDHNRRLLPAIAGHAGPAAARYGEVMGGLFETIAEVSQRPIVVDSSKHIGRAANLLDCDGLDVYLLHLVRDGRAVMWSRIRDALRDPGTDRRLRRRLPSYSIAGWTAKNAAAMALGQRAGDRYLRLRYEDLLAQPTHELQRLGAWLGTPMDPLIDGLATPGTLSRRAGHQIGGNARTRQGGDELTLRLDAEWPRKLSRARQAQFWALAGWLASAMGYRAGVEA